MRKFWFADNSTEIENGWTVYTDAVIGSREFWAACDAELNQPGAATKAVEINEEGEWLGRPGCEIVWR